MGVQSPLGERRFTQSLDAKRVYRSKRVAVVYLDRKFVKGLSQLTSRVWVRKTRG